MSSKSETIEHLPVKANMVSDASNISMQSYILSKVQYVLFDPSDFVEEVVSNMAVLCGRNFFPITLALWVKSFDAVHFRLFTAFFVAVAMPPPAMTTVCLSCRIRRMFCQCIDIEL